MTQKQNNMDTIISSVGCLKGGWTIFGEASRMGKQTFFHFSILPLWGSLLDLNWNGRY